MYVNVCSFTLLVTVYLCNQSIGEPQGNICNTMYHLMTVHTQSLQTHPSSQKFPLSIRDTVYIKYLCCTNRKWSLQKGMTYFPHIAPKELSREKHKRGMFSQQGCSFRPQMNIILILVLSPLYSSTPS